MRAFSPGSWFCGKEDADFDNSPFTDHWKKGETFPHQGTYFQSPTLDVNLKRGKPKPQHLCLSQPPSFLPAQTVPSPFPFLPLGLNHKNQTFGWAVTKVPALPSHRCLITHLPVGDGTYPLSLLPLSVRRLLTPSKCALGYQPQTNFFPPALTKTWRQKRQRTNFLPYTSKNYCCIFERRIIFSKSVRQFIVITLTIHWNII